MIRFEEQTRLDALRALLATDEPMADERIGHRYVYRLADRRVSISAREAARLRRAAERRAA